MLPIITHPDTRLRLQSERIEDIDTSVRELVENMFESMYQTAGFGLAAIQVAVPKRLVVMDLAQKEGERDPQVFINPEILSFGDEIAPYHEGCLSLPDLYIDVDRPTTVRVRYQDLSGKMHEHDADGLLARCFQHELDHLDGLLITDRVSRLKREMALRKYEKLRRIKADQ